MFTARRREQVRTHLLERARRDERITGAAITGSAASALIGELRHSDTAVAERLSQPLLAMAAG